MPRPFLSFFELARGARVLGCAGLVVVLGCCLDVRSAQAQPTSDLRELAIAVEARTDGARSLAYRLAPESPPALRNALECFEVAFAAAALAEASSSDDTSPLDHVARRLTTLATEVDKWLAAAPACAEDAPAEAEMLGDLGTMRVRLAYLKPEIERAARLADEALERSAVDTTPTLLAEADRLHAALELPPTSASPWAFVEAVWSTLDTPPAVSREWPARSSAPTISSVIVGLVAGAIAVFGSLPSLASGRRIFPAVAGAYGLFFGALASSLSGVGWQTRGRAFPIVGAVVTSLTAAAGVLSVVLLPDERGRYFGGGLLIGAGIGALWTVGSFAHQRHHDDADHAWREYLRGLSVGADRRGASVRWQTTF